MWKSFEARLDENESDRPLPLRRALFDVLRRSGLRPGGGVTKKMVSFDVDFRGELTRAFDRELTRLDDGGLVRWWSSSSFFPLSAWRLSPNCS